MEGLELFERVTANKIDIEDEEEAFMVFLSQNMFDELEGTGLVRCHLLLGVSNFELLLLLQGGWSELLM